MLFRTATLVVALLVGGTLASPARAVPRPVEEGGDTQPCVTYEEFDVDWIGWPRRRVERVFDTKGHRVVTDQFVGMPGDSGGSLQNRNFRAYPVCIEPDLQVTGGEVLVEYGNGPRHRANQAMGYGGRVAVRAPQG